MCEKYTWILTDLENRIYTGNWNMTPALLGDVPGIGGGWSITKTRLQGGVSDGVDVIEVNNGRLSFAVIPTSGMSIWRGNCDGNFIGWDSPARFPVHPSQVNVAEQGGLGWLKAFNQCLVRCGCNSNGAPGLDRIIDNNGNVAEVTLTLHGKVALTPACLVKIQVIPGDPAEIVISGIVEESRCFSPQYRLFTRISTKLGSNCLTVDDQVLNFGDSPAELQMLYHCNFSNPFLEGGSTMVAPIGELAPRDKHAAEDIATFATYKAPEPGYVEQCYFIDMNARPDGSTLAMLKNASGTKAAVVRWNKKQLPCFCQWKHTTGSNEGYVTGLEPATNFPNQKVYERAHGRVLTLAPGETKDMSVTWEFANDADSVKALEKEIQDVQKGRTPMIHGACIEKWSPAN